MTDGIVKAVLKYIRLKKAFLAVSACFVDKRILEGVVGLKYFIKAYGKILFHQLTFLKTQPCLIFNANI